MRKALFAVAILALVSATWVCAEPSMHGYTGLLEVPTADTLGENDYNLAVTTSEMSDWDDRAYMGNMGFQSNIEAGLYVLRPDTGPSETIFNIKHQFQAAAPGRASFAVGVADLTDEMDTSVYVVGSKPLEGEILGTNMTLHGGFGGGWIDDFFCGVEAELAPSLSIIGEHFNDDISVGARWQLTDHFVADGGYMNTDDWRVTLSYNYPQ